VGKTDVGFERSMRCVRSSPPEQKQTTEEAEKWMGHGTALKPAHEPIKQARKDFTVIPFRDIVLEIGAILETISCLMLDAKCVEEFFISSNQDSSVSVSSFVQWIVEEKLGRQKDEQSPKTDIFKLQEMGKIFLSIVGLWNSILEDDLNRPNKYTTKTATSKIIELKILSLSLLQDISQNIIHVQGSKVDGLNVFVSNVERFSKEERLKLQDILSLSVPEDAILKTGIVAVEELANFVKKSSTIQTQNTDFVGESVSINGVKVGQKRNTLKYLFSHRNIQSDAPFYYEAKASTRERNYGCKNLFWMTTDDGTKPIEKEEYTRLAKENSANKDKEGYVPHRVAHGNCWPTCKPIQLCRYLVKMVKMPGDNLILDPFCGSGTTAIACILEGCDFLTMDNDPVAYEIAKTRIHYFQCLGKKGLK
jgi:hypothetical protein